MKILVLFTGGTIGSTVDGATVHTDPAAASRLPVSYTHLDVYKRQGLHCVISTAIGLQIPIRLMITCTSVTMCPSRNILRSFLSMCRATISWRR